MNIVLTAGSLLDLLSAGSLGKVLFAIGLTIAGFVFYYAVRRAGGTDFLVDKLFSKIGFSPRFFVAILSSLWTRLLVTAVILVVIISVGGIIVTSAYVNPDTLISSSTYGPLRVAKFPAYIHLMNVDGRECPIVHVHTVVTNVTGDELRVVLLQAETSISDEGSGSRLDFDAPLRVGGAPNVPDVGYANWDNYLSIEPGARASLDLTTNDDPSTNTCLNSDAGSPSFDAATTPIGRINATVALRVWGPDQSDIRTISFPLNDLPLTN